MQQQRWETSSLGERIKRLCELRGLSLNKLAKITGIESGPMSRLSRRDEHIAGAVETLVKISTATGIELRWLADGTGPIEIRPQNREIEERRQLAAELAREAGADEAAIQSVLAEEVAEEDRGRPTLWWADRMRRRVLELADLGGSAPRRPALPSRSSSSAPSAPPSSGPSSAPPSSAPAFDRPSPEQSGMVKKPAGDGRERREEGGRRK